jgi:hypothetical protein
LLPAAAEPFEHWFYIHEWAPLIIFFGTYLGIVRNKKIPHVARYHIMMVRRLLAVYVVVSVCVGIAVGCLPVHCNKKIPHVARYHIMMVRGHLAVYVSVGIAVVCWPGHCAQQEDPTRGTPPHHDGEAASCVSVGIAVVCLPVH